MTMKFLSPRGDTVIQANDRVIVFALPAAVPQAAKLFGGLANDADSSTRLSQPSPAFKIFEEIKMKKYTALTQNLFRHLAAARRCNTAPFRFGIVEEKIVVRGLGKDGRQMELHYRRRSGSEEGFSKQQFKNIFASREKPLFSVSIRSRGTPGSVREKTGGLLPNATPLPLFLTTFSWRVRCCSPMAALAVSVLPITLFGRALLAPLCFPCFFLTIRFSGLRYAP